MNFNGFDFTSLLIVEDIVRSVLPSKYPEGISIPGHEGLRFSQTTTASNIIIAKCRVIKETRKEVQSTIREIAGKLHTKEPQKLTLRDEPHLYNIAIVSGITDVEKYLFTGRFEIVFECMDPHAYGTERSFALNSLFDNNGTAYAHGVIEFKPNAGNSATIELLNSPNVNVLKLIHNFNGSETVRVDLEKQQIKINNNNGLQYLSLDSDFFMIPPQKGLKIKVSGSGTIKFRERWI